MFILLVIDGLRADALSPETTPNLWALKNSGMWTLRGQAEYPSISMPCHMSMFHSVPVTRHGLTDNNWSPMARPVEGIVETLRRNGKKIGAVYGWEGFRNLWQPLHTDFDIFRRCKNHPTTNDAFLLDEALRWIELEEPDFLFLHFDTVDGAGHRHGWMSEPYLRQTTHVDELIGRLSVSLPDAGYMVLADHGGHDRDHGSDQPEDMTIPLILYGPGIPASGEIEEPVSLLDCAPTIASWFGVESNEDWEGRKLINC